MSAIEMRAKWALCFIIGISFALQGRAATAAEASASTGPSEGLEEIVVTGTLIRGVAPPGTQLITLSTLDIAELGIADTTQILESLPQDGYFNNRPQVGNFGQYQTIIRPSLRY